MVSLNKYILLATMMIASFIGYAQIKFEGKVIVDDFIPVANAKVTHLKSGEITYTNTLGKFTFQCKLKDKLLIEAKGFSSKKIKIKGKSATVLLELSKQIDSDKIALSNEHILNKDGFKEYLKKKENPNDFSRYTNAVQIIKDRYPNVKVETYGLVIRGRSSLQGSNYAAIEIDGVLMDFDALTSLPTATIKSIKVLTASQSALYGSDGGNGVVKVTTFK